MSVMHHINTGNEYARQGNLDEAIKSFSQALDEEPDHPVALLGRAKAFYRLQRGQEALTDLDRLVKAFPDNGRYYIERGVLLHLAGQRKEAMKDFDQAIQIDPSDPYFWSSRAFIKDRLGDYAGSLEDYSKAIELDPDDAIAHNNKGLVEEKLGKMEESKRSFARADDLDPAGRGDQPSSGNPDNTTPPKAPEVRSPGKPVPSEKLTFTGYFRTLRSVLSDKGSFGEFLSYLKDSLGKKQ